MTRTTRHLIVGAMLAGLVGAGRPAVAAGADQAASGPFGGPQGRRVRSSSVAITALIEQASERSKTFRGLVETINASDGIVYVEQGRCRHGVRACFVTVTMAGPTRILWVNLDPRKADSDLMGSIGHELRHTLEALSDRSVTSHQALYFFYARVGSHGLRAIETAAAIEAGDAVRAEIRQPSHRTEPLARTK